MRCLAPLVLAERQRATRAALNGMARWCKASRPKVVMSPEADAATMILDMVAREARARGRKS